MPNNNYCNIYKAQSLLIKEGSYINNSNIHHNEFNTNLLINMNDNTNNYTSKNSYFIYLLFCYVLSYVILINVWKHSLQLNKNKRYVWNSREHDSNYLSCKYTYKLSPFAIPFVNVLADVIPKSPFNNIYIENNQWNKEIPIIIENEDMCFNKEGHTVDNEDQYILHQENNNSYNDITIQNSNLDPNATIYIPYNHNRNIHNNSVFNPINNNNKDDIYSILNAIRVKNIHRVIIGHLNINSIRNKFVALSDIMKNNIDIILISETKIDKSFTSSTFYIDDFTPPYRLDRTSRGGGILLYVRSDIPSKELKYISIPNNNECMFIEINLHKKKWLICSFYNPSKNQIKNQLSFLSKCMDYYLPLYDNIIVMGDFNSEPTETYMNEFIKIYDLKNLVNEPTCYKNLTNPSCIDLILTNRSKSFQNTVVVETGLSDFHKMTITIMKTYFKKKETKDHSI